MSQVCIAAAVQTIEVLEGNLRQPLRMMSSLALFMIFSATTVLIAATLRPGSESQDSVVERAMLVLDRHRYHTQRVSDVREQLQAFIATVAGVRARREPHLGEWLGENRCCPPQVSNCSIRQARWHRDK